MSHNYSDRKLHALDAAELSRLVSGWIFGKDSRVEEPQTPAGVLARGATLQARCGKRSDCGRRVTFDAAQWCDAGHALTALSDVLLAYGCGLVPCRLQWLPERYPAGRPFGTYLRDGKAGVAVRCECREFKPKEYPLLTFVKAMLAGAGPGAWLGRLNLYGWARALSFSRRAWSAVSARGVVRGAGGSRFTRRRT